MIAEHQAAILAARDIEHSAAQRLPEAELHLQQVLDRCTEAKALVAAADARVKAAAGAWASGSTEGSAAFETARHDRQGAMELLDALQATVLPDAETQCETARQDLAAAQATLRKATGRAIAIDKLLPAYVAFRDAMIAGQNALDSVEGAQREISAACKSGEIAANSTLYDPLYFGLLTPVRVRTEIQRFGGSYHFDVLGALRAALALPTALTPAVASSIDVIPADDAAPADSQSGDNSELASSAIQSDAATGKGWRRGGRRGGPNEMVIGFTDD